MRVFRARPGTGVLQSVRRHYIRVRGREIHYSRAGSGPPVVLLHAAMASARSQLPLMQRLASDHTVFAFDHPGMGDSEPLRKRNVEIADAADALKETLTALKIPGCPIFGSHTGGAVALELALRHPERVSALVMEGVTAFDPQERRFFLSEEYMPPFAVKADGSHLFAAWVKARDHFVWFPWNDRTAKNRIRIPLETWEGVHDMFLEILRAGDAYRNLYGAAFRFNARRSLSKLTVPATLMARAGDPLLPHLKRLPRLSPNQHVRRHPADPVAFLDETARVLRGYRIQADAPPDAPFQCTAGVISRRYLDFSGGQILLRSAGEARKGRPLLLLHDGRDSSVSFEPLMSSLAQYRPVFAPDLPDNGASDPLVMPSPDIEDYVRAIEELLAALSLAPCDIYAVGAGAAVALEALARPAFATSTAVLEAPDFYAVSFARNLSRAWVPALQPRADGAHLNLLWLMLRDEFAFWPWFDKSPAGVCAVDAPTEWHSLHSRITGVLRSLPTYHRLTKAALKYKWLKSLRRMRRRTIRLATEANDPRRPHAEIAARLARFSAPAVLPAVVEKKATQILLMLRG